MKIARTAATWLYRQVRAELTIQQAPRKSASEKIQENKILKNGLNGFAMLVLIVAGCAVLVL